MSKERVVFLGPPGAGKGTHATALVKEAGLRHLSTGDMLRQAVKEGTELGKLAAKFMESGQLVPDEVMIDVLLTKLRDEAIERFILDGFPRTVPQAEALDQKLSEIGLGLDSVLLFEVSSEELVRRLSSRVVCKDCGATYNRLSQPSKVEGICDRCGAAALYTRPDDQPDAVAKRLDVYTEQTAPLIEYYAEKGCLQRIDASRSIAEIREEVCSVLQSI